MCKWLYLGSAGVSCGHADPGDVQAQALPLFTAVGLLLMCLSSQLQQAWQQEVVHEAAQVL